jgi:hypothetical protein
LASASLLKIRSDSTAKLKGSDESVLEKIAGIGKMNKASLRILTILCYFPDLKNDLPVIEEKNVLCSIEETRLDKLDIFEIKDLLICLIYLIKNLSQGIEFPKIKIMVLILLTCKKMRYSLYGAITTKII